MRPESFVSGARLDARVKLLAALGFIAMALGGPLPIAPALVGTAAFLFAARIGRFAGTLGRALRVAGLACGFAFLARLLASGGAVESARSAANLALCTGASTAILSLLVAATPPWEMAPALRALRLPDALVEVLALAGRYVAVLGAAARTSWEAQAMRLGYSDGRRAVRSGGELIGLSLLRAFAQAEATAEAVAARGGSLCLACASPPLSRSDRRAAATFFGLWLAMAAIAFGGSR